ncbi:protein of unknown function [Ralstonia solanacearum CFBP2957]|nr:protein of unknown function [Ralstonia solanacearum CFBP2957]
MALRPTADDRDGSFQPLLIPKHERRFKSFDNKIIAIYARA